MRVEDTLFGFFHQFQKLGAGHLAQNGRGEWIGLTVIVDVHVQTIHHVEVRVGKQFFHGRVLDIDRHLVAHKRTEVGRRRELTHIVQRRGGE